MIIERLRKRANEIEMMIREQQAMGAPLSTGLLTLAVDVIDLREAADVLQHAEELI